MHICICRREFLTRSQYDRHAKTCIVPENILEEIRLEKQAKWDTLSSEEQELANRKSRWVKDKRAIWEIKKYYKPISELDE